MTEHARKRRYDALTDAQKAIYWGMRANLATYDEAIEEAERKKDNRGGGDSEKEDKI